ncbi:exodeoxyribonuclease V subunit beta [Candidatus Enterovibrio escicola]|uniref:exodeoxyribonuclease V subunit beta n=1 Tax=Candidatus Enterovibrio escicola TaxID=1927127 RepID=UPI001237A342|nr:exodeoxyribonuclease V subunit beta [Candidatus Enterovibrio escacola]
MQNQTLHTLSFPLHGQRLIEASAGTGKTFTIAGLYLRLLLGHGSKETAHQIPLTVDKILVVTFTEAATQELKNRIRERIHDARLAFSRGKSGNPAIQPLLDAMANHSDGERLLLQAERQMDESAIYTIHGFCRRMLAQNAFESGSLFTTEFLTDETALHERAVADFWRQQFYPLARSLVGVVSGYWNGPSALLKEISMYLSGPLVTIIAPLMPDDLAALHKRNLQRIDDVKIKWLEAVNNLELLIYSSGVDKRIYNKRTLPNWLAEISKWANQPTSHYCLPTKFNRFSANTLSEKTKKGEAPQHPVFEAIDRLLAKPFTLKDMLTAHAIREVRYLLAQEKRRSGRLSFDELLSQLAESLRKDNGKLLATCIRTLYPVAMIDEFQDTDPQQYQIFSDIYANSPHCGLFMIGDPKQAIYAFRGADIFTYIHARRQVENHYNLSTNWRSTADMVAAVNHVFKHAYAPFIYEEDIPFLAVEHSPNSNCRYWSLNGETQVAMTFWLEEGTDLQTKNDYEEKMASATASSIHQILGAAIENRAYFYNGKRNIKVKANNITVLVRTRSEAVKVKQALARQDILSVYLSNRDSVFVSPLALDLQRLLTAVLTPDNDRALRTALASRLFALTAKDIDTLNHDEEMWERVVIEFSTYQTIWFNRGVLPMLRKVIQHRMIAERLLCEENGDRLLTDLLHLGELLQQESQTLDSHHALLRWLVDHIDSPNGNCEEQQVRLESERDLVRIVTIHKSKGLEYGLVYLPFSCNFRPSDRPFFHKNDSTPVLELTNSEFAIEMSDRERLAEDLRLIYVALTRAIYGCFIGLAPLKNGRRSYGDTGLHKSAMGYLIQRGIPADVEGLHTAVSSLLEGQVHMRVTPPPCNERGKLPFIDGYTNLLSARIFKGSIRNHWKLTSYSRLVNQGYPSSLSELTKFDVYAKEELLLESDKTIETCASIFQFPCGKRHGTFLHTLFEHVAFWQDMYHEDVENMIRHALSLENYDEAWTPVLQKLLTDVVSHPLDDGLTLSKIDDVARLTEMEFIMPLDSLQCNRVNRHIKRYDTLSAKAGDLKFDTVSGMLKGFIDLVFCWKGRYYVVDWKSNYLGDSSADYTKDALASAMVEHRYDFQYQIYSLALHRFLSQRLVDYDITKHFGGVYYLFIRGIEADMQHGIFYIKPSKALIDGLDTLFNNGVSNADES